MNYYLLEYSDDKTDNLPKGKNPILVNDYDLKGFDLRTLWRGIPIESWSDSYDFYFEKGTILLDYIPNVLSWLIFSNEAIKIFDIHNIKNIQHFPITICGKANKNKRYNVNVVNVLEQIEALNWEKSDYVSWEDDPKYIKFIRNIVLTSNVVNSNLEIFRLQESKNYIIVSERIVETVKRLELTGFRFKCLEIA